MGNKIDVKVQISRYPDFSIIQHKMNLFALDNVSEMKGVYRVPLVPVYQCTRAEARVVTVGSDQVRPRVYLVLISRPAQPPSVHQPLVTTPQPAPVSEQPASGQHRHPITCDQHLHSLRHVVRFSCIDCCCVMLCRTRLIDACSRDEIVMGFVDWDWMCSTNPCHGGVAG